MRGWTPKHHFRILPFKSQLVLGEPQRVGDECVLAPLSLPIAGLTLWCQELRGETQVSPQVRPAMQVLNLLMGT